MAIRDQLESIVFVSDEETEKFILSIVAPDVGRGAEHVRGLYRVLHEDRFKSTAAKLGIHLLRSYPNAHAHIQVELLQAALHGGMSNEVKELALEKLSVLADLDIVLQRAWMSALFVVDFESSRAIFIPFFLSDKDSFWVLSDFVHRDSSRHRQSAPISVEQRELLIQLFASTWPPADHPSSSYGRTNPWNASDIIRRNIIAIGAIGSDSATASLTRLSSDEANPYRPLIKHVLAQQLRLKRDTNFLVPTFAQIKQQLSSGLPDSIDDIKALILDNLELAQDYIRNGDTNAWESFWNGDTPKRENTCRDRLLDHLRSELPDEVVLLPEITMPDANRADIVAVYRKLGVPIEIKGQWHPEVWKAASVQLIEKYGRDWRADDRGIYLVLWFGNVPGKNLPRHPADAARPDSPQSLRDLLLAQLTDQQRSTIDVFVLDVSRP